MSTRKDIDYSHVPKEVLERAIERIRTLRRHLTDPPVLGLTTDEGICLNSAYMRLGEAEGRLQDELERRQAQTALPVDPVDPAGPQYEHDCPCCTFLGRYEYEGESYDLYHCTQAGTLPTLLARYSSRGPDYKSGMEFGRAYALKLPIQHMMDDGTIETRPADPAAPLGEAYQRARARGLSLR